MVVVPTLDRNAIARLVGVCIRRVVYEHRLTEVTAQHGEVFEVVALHNQAGLSEEAVLDVLSLGVQLIQKDICVDFLRRCEKHNL